MTGLLGAVALMAVALSGCGGQTPAAGTAPRDPVVRLAQRDIAVQMMKAIRGYEGPSSGPIHRPHRFVVFVAGDVTNGGIAGVAHGVSEAAEAIGWRLRVLDGDATIAGRRQAMQQALALRPDGIILGGFDPTEQRSAMRQAAIRGIPVVGWHSGSDPGPNRGAALFTNVTTDPLAVARLAARYVIAHSGGRAGVAIFYDSQFRIAVAKAKEMKAALMRCAHCRLLAMVDSPIADASIRMPAVISALIDRYGSKLTYMLAINGNYFSDSRAALFALGKSGTDPPFAVAAGDGDAAEFQRIRAGDYQVASIAEPLYLQGWQLVDEINRALSGKPPSGYIAPPRLITAADVPNGNVFDPSTEYRDAYRRIWRVQGA